MTLPADVNDVRNAVRLGWHVAELRARMMLYVPSRSKPASTAYRLPLSAERTAGELAIQAEAIVIEMAQRLKVDFDRPLSYEARNSRGKATARLMQIDKRILQSTGAAADSARGDLALFLFAWDEKIQDALGSASSAHDAAYTVGRGFAEVLWCPDARKPPLGSAKDRVAVLAKSRRDDLRRGIERLSDYFDALVAPAVLVSLDAWADVVASEAWQSDELAMEALERQSAIWHDLVLAERAPHSLLTNRPGNLTQYRYSVAPVLGKFLPQIALTLLSFIVLSIGVWVLSQSSHGSSTSGSGPGAIISLLGLLGITTTGATARLKSVSTDLISKMRSAIDADLVSTAAADLPAPRNATLAGIDLRFSRRKRYSALR